MVDNFDKKFLHKLADDILVNALQFRMPIFIKFRMPIQKYFNIYYSNIISLSLSSPNTCLVFTQNSLL